MDKQTEINWQNLAERLEHEFSNDLLNCNDSYERLFLKKQLQKELPEISDARIDYMLDHCCKMLPAPRTIKDVVGCLKKLVS